MSSKADIVSIAAIVATTAIAAYPLQPRKKEVTVKAEEKSIDTQMAFAKSNRAGRILIFNSPNGKVISELRTNTYIGVVAGPPADGWLKLMVGIEENGNTQAYYVWARHYDLHIPKGLAEGKAFERKSARDKS